MNKVSILVPVYNAEKHIEKCAISLFSQTYSHLEYMFIDDCTPDNSIAVLLKVLEDYPERKEHTKIIRNEHNLGAAASKNIAIEHATGEFLCFVDSDDWIDLNAIELLIRKYMETNADVVWGRMAIHTNEGVFMLEEPVFQSKQQWVNYYISEDDGGTLLSNSRRIIRRDLVESNRIRMKEGLNYSEDRLFMNQVAYYAQGFSIIDETVYHYNKLNDNSQTEKKVGEKEYVEKVNQIIGNYGLIEEFFSNKEREYYKEASVAKLKILKRVMDAALRYPSRALFNSAVKSIYDTDQEFWYAIGWNRSSCWRGRHGNYYFRRFLPIARAYINKWIRK